MTTRYTSHHVNVRVDANAGGGVSFTTNGVWQNLSYGGTRGVRVGTTVEVGWAASVGHRIASVVVDGTPTTTPSDVGSLTLPNVQTAHRIAITFVAAP